MLDVANVLYASVICVLVKVLLGLGSYYKSTDFEVHRNWLAITHSLPLHEWYRDDTSEWTLDYPPFFAYFQWFLSQFASYFDRDMLIVASYYEPSYSTIAFQRLSVVFVDSFLFTSTFSFLQSNSKSLGLKNSEDFVSYVFVIFNAGLLLVDHVHFQYNGLLIGLLIFCFDCAFRQRYILLTITFSSLIFMKHLNVLLLPIFVIFLIRRYCEFKVTYINRSLYLESFNYLNFLKLVLISVIMVCLAFLSFTLRLHDNEDSYIISYCMEEVQQILNRLFPFQRGLVHAYWAPNVYALYCFLDKAVSFITKKIYQMSPLGLHVIPHHIFLARLTRLGSGSASGIVGSFTPVLLPSIEAPLTLCLTLLGMCPAFYKLYKAPNAAILLKCGVYCSFTSFMLGYHVHEKAVLVPMILQAFLAMQSIESLLLYIKMAAVAIFSFFPLFTNFSELPVKVVLFTIYIYGAVLVLKSKFGAIKVNRVKFFSVKLLLFSLVILFVFVEVVCPYCLKGLYPFMPLLAISTCLACWNVHLWYELYTTL